MADARSGEWDYVIVGSGAGGGTLAARLAESGMRVFLLEAGGDATATGAPRLPDDYQVPGFHAFASENAAMSWDFWVRHYADKTQQQRDPKYDPERDGVLYPRAATLGGCTAHNAMIFMLPHDSDWDHIAHLSGDSSWRASAMRRHARRIEACHYRPLWRALRYLGIDPTRHGWSGWLRTEEPEELQGLADKQLVSTFVESSLAFARTRPWWQLARWLRSLGDPNTRSFRGRSFEGLCYTPLSTERHARIGARERLLRVAAAHPDRLHIELEALATRVILSDTNTALGVEYLKGERLYRTGHAVRAAAGTAQRILARREVILCGGAFNTPQLLMLSGIGPAAHLQQQGIPVRLHLPRVGRNLQDRYEVAVTHRMQRPWNVLDGARFEHGDPLWERWERQRDGIYASNGAALAFVGRSGQRLPEPDLFGMALPTRFEGYFPGFSGYLQRYHDYLTWAVLKAHTRNRAGSVELRSPNPLDPPRINFRYFEEGDDKDGHDLGALVRAIELVRKLTAPLIASGVIAEECQPGPGIQTPEALASYIRDTAWGHHASCSCAIGRDTHDSVLNAAFEVHGTRGLRVVDASVFPRIPGFFLVSAVYMIAEKAAETILKSTTGEKSDGVRGVTVTRDVADTAR
jgi:choline dehydrogenase-like flavoprotein